MRPEGLALVRFAALRELVRSVARLLEPRGIEIAPLKGALVLGALGGDPLVRAVSDVDLLVPSARFDEAVARLSEDGWALHARDRDDRTVTLRSARSPLVLDLHRRLFSSELFRFDEAAILARARPDVRVFDAPVRLPTSEDAASHAIAHHAAGRPIGDPARLRHDLGCFVEAGLEPRGLAARLDADGARRALALARLELPESPILTASGDLLGLRPIEQILADVVRTLARRTQPDGPLASIARHLLADHASAGVRSAMHHAASRARGLRRDR